MKNEELAQGELFGTGTARKSPRSAFSDAECLTIRGEYEAGQNSRQLAEKYKRSQPTILNAIRHAGGTVRDSRDVNREQLRALGLKNRKPVTDEDRARALALYAEPGATYQSVARQMKRNGRVVLGILKEAGVLRSRGGKDPGIWPEAVAAYAAGESSVSVAKRIGSTATTVLAHAREAGVPIREVRGSTFHPERNAQVVELRGAGTSVSEVAKAMGLSPSHVSQILRSAGRAPQKNVAEKGCPWCGETKLRSEFFVANMACDGLSSYCKVCLSARQKAYKDECSRGFCRPKGIGYFRRCSGCELWMSRADLQSPRGARRWLCLPCLRDRTRGERRKDPEKFRRRNRRSKRRLRKEAIAAYGGACACCGETTPEFLAIDHVDGGGHQHYRETKGDVLRDLKRRGWPKEGFRILCHNCNCGRERFGGTCPHKLASPVAAPEPPTPTTKRCLRCEEVKPVADFFRRTGGGHQSNCRACDVARHSEHRRFVRSGAVLPTKARVGIGVFKWCSRCDLWKVKATGFVGKSGWCRGCMREYQATEQCRTVTNARNRKNRRKLTAEVFTAYGGRCACCGESNFGFLTVDHIFGDGHAERKTAGKKDIYLYLRRMRFPKDRYQVLCFNCNSAKGSGKVCPHQRCDTLTEPASGLYPLA